MYPALSFCMALILSSGKARLGGFFGRSQVHDGGGRNGGTEQPAIAMAILYQGHGVAIAHMLDFAMSL